MLKSRYYANILQDFITSLAEEMKIEIKFKITIRLDFSLMAQLFMDIPDNFRIDYLEGEEEQILQSKFGDFLQGYRNNDFGNNLLHFGTEIFVPDVRFDISPLNDADSPLNQRMLKGDNIEFGAKYRLASLIDIPSKRISTEWGKIPVITFYSYKGGMGRTTTLMAYALYLAAKDKKVAVVDCDLEAPGYLNFFNLSNQQELMKGERNGLVEYFSDYTFADREDKYIDLAKYVVIPDSISQGGEERDYIRNIIIVPGGNLNYVNDDITMDYAEKKSLSQSEKDYMEGLSRLNLSNPHVTREAVTSLFTKLNKDYNVDVILVDSRTGFNDIFGTIALSMSDHVVGFVGFSDQTIPGLRQLYRYYVQENADFRFDIVTNLIPNDADQSWIENGRSKLLDVWQTESEGKDKKTPGHYLLHRMSILERLGTGDESADARLVTLVEDILDEDKRRDITLEIGEMGSLFEHLSKEANLETEIVSKEYVDNDNPNADMDETIQRDNSSKVSPFRMQKEILNYTKRKFNDIHVFAEDTNIENSTFFYRKCMADFFNPKKFIILGSKGSGKSMLYRALGTPDYEDTAKFILDCAKKTALKEKYDYAIPDWSDIVCLNTISLKKDVEFNFNLFFDKLSTDKLKLFWMIYTWNAMMTDENLASDAGFRSNVISRSKIADCIVSLNLNSFDKAARYQELVEKDFSFLGEIEKDFDRINSFLEKKGKRLYILYDGLDNINPRTWTKNISPLVDFWRDRTDKYSHIKPKLFIRTDLFAYIEGTNTLRLKEAAINIDWTLEEVFGYFFKIILSDDNIKRHFWTILEKLDKGAHIQTIQNSWDEEAAQFLYPGKGVLMPLVKIYFGEKIDEARNLSSWDFFKNSLSNANKGISLRPFINLLGDKVIDAAIQDSDRYVKAILPSKYYATPDNRDNAANGNFEDMAKGGDFTSDILKFREFLRSSNGDRYRYKELDEKDFDRLLSDIIDEYGSDNLISRNKADLSNQLIAAGIVAMIPRGRKFYRFADMYHYTWGLANAENWERGTLAYGQRGRLVVITQDGRRISFKPYNEPKDAMAGDKIEYKLVQDFPGSYKVDMWRPFRRR